MKMRFPFLAFSMLLLSTIPSWAATTVDYSYDELGRLTNAQYQSAAPLGTVSYSYDSVGNITVATVIYSAPRCDLNYDGIISLKDTILALKMLSGQDTPGLNASGDIDNDKRVGISEAIYSLVQVASE